MEADFSFLTPSVEKGIPLFEVKFWLLRLMSCVTLKCLRREMYNQSFFGTVRAWNKRMLHFNNRLEKTQRQATIHAIKRGPEMEPACNHQTLITKHFFINDLHYLRYYLILF